MDPKRALANLHSLTPTPREAELLAPALPRLLSVLVDAADPDMALNNLERYAAVVDRPLLFATLHGHPGAAQLLARVGGASQFLADTLRRRPATLAWLLEGATMRQWLAEDLTMALVLDLASFTTRESRLNVLRRFKYRHLLRIGARDLLGDADLIATTEDLSRLADVCIAAAWRDSEAALREQYGPPDGSMAAIGMGKLGGEELNYSSDVDLIFVYSADGETAGGSAGRLPNGEFFARIVRETAALLETITEEGHVFRVDLRLRPEGRVGSPILSLDGYRRYLTERAEAWERQALIKARFVAGDETLGRRFADLVRPFVYRAGVDPGVVDEIRAMKRQIDRLLRDRDDRRNVKLGRGGIREIEFLVQALQLLYGGDDQWLQERHTLKALFRLVERGYLSPELGRALSDGYIHLRTVEHRLQIVHEFQTHSLPAGERELEYLARRVGIRAGAGRGAREFRRRHARVTAAVRRAFTEFFAPTSQPRRGLDRGAGAARRKAGARGREPDTTAVRVPSLTALRATGFSDPERARRNLRLVLEGRPLIPYPTATRASLARLLPVLIDALWKSPDPDEALHQFERFVATSGPRTGYLGLLAEQPDVLLNLVRLCARGELLADLLVPQPELLTSLARPEILAAPKREGEFRAVLATALALGITPAERRDRLRRHKQAEELGIVWRHLLSVTTLDQYSREMTALAEAALMAAWVTAGVEQADRVGEPATGAVLVGVGKLGGRELTAGSDLDLFVIYGNDTDRAHAFYTGLVERLAGLLGDITAAGVVFPVDLRLRPGSKGSGFAGSLPAFQHYYRHYGDLWERQALTRARLILGDPALGRRVATALREVVYGTPLPRADAKEITEVRRRMEVELGKETPGRLHVKYGRGGLVDVEFLVQTLQLIHGTVHRAVRRPNTLHGLAALARARLLPTGDANALADHYRALRGVSLALRLFGARPTDMLDVAGPMPARLARSLGYADREAFLTDYRDRTEAVRGIFERALDA